MTENKVTFRTKSGTICSIKTGVALQEFAMRWLYVTNNRNRWTRNTSARNRHRKQLKTELGKLGIKGSHLNRIAKAGIVEVKIPFEVETVDWEARIAPWEYILTTATEENRNGEDLIVFRHLNCGRRTKPKAPQTISIVQSAPGKFEKEFEFDAENSLVRAALSRLRSETIENPTPRKLASDIKKHSPSVIHVTGVDTRLGKKLLGETSTDARDGIYLAKGRSSQQEVGADEIAAHLNSGELSPAFVGFNIWDSASRMAPLCISKGAHAAVGFQSSFDDGIAEMFYVNFYRACVETEWNFLQAFLTAWQSISSFRRRIRGTGIVLWSARSLIANTKFKNFRELKANTRLHRERKKASIQSKRTADPTKDKAKEFVSVSVRVKERLNYSLLHNRHGIFD